MPRRAATPRRSSQARGGSSSGRARQRISHSPSCASLHASGSFASLRKGRSRSKSSRGSRGSRGDLRYTTPRRSVSSISLGRAEPLVPYFVPPTPAPSPSRLGRSRTDYSANWHPSPNAHRKENNWILSQMKQYLCGQSNTPPNPYVHPWGNAPYVWNHRFTNFALPPQAPQQHGHEVMHGHRAPRGICHLPNSTTCVASGSERSQLHYGATESMLPPRMYQNPNVPARPSLSKQIPHPELEFLYNDTGDPELARSMFWTYCLFCLSIFTVVVFVVYFAFDRTAI